jgi:ABC-type antimicrobial peptide transport system permease subunit
MARAVWANESPIGARIKFGEPESDAPWLTVVGVVGTPEDAQNNRTRNFAYVPFAQQPDRQVRLMVRTRDDPLAIVPSIRAEIAALQADLPLQDIRTMETDLARSYWPVRFYATTLSSMAVFAALLGALGVWGIVAYAVTLRTREIGIRVALGATSARVLRMIALEGLWLAGIGLVLGLAGSAVVTRVIGAMLYGTSPVDPLVFSFVSVLFGAIALLASLVPARRATRVDPMIALRSE